MLSLWIHKNPQFFWGRSMVLLDDFSCHIRQVHIAMDNDHHFCHGLPIEKTGPFSMANVAEPPEAVQRCVCEVSHSNSICPHCTMPCLLVVILPLCPQWMNVNINCLFSESYMFLVDRWQPVKIRQKMVNEPLLIC